MGKRGRGESRETESDGWRVWLPGTLRDMNYHFQAARQPGEPLSRSFIYSEEPSSSLIRQPWALLCATCLSFQSQVSALHTILPSLYHNSVLS